MCIDSRVVSIFCFKGACMVLLDELMQKLQRHRLSKIRSRVQRAPIADCVVVETELVLHPVRPVLDTVDIVIGLDHRGAIARRACARRRRRAVLIVATVDTRHNCLLRIEVKYI